MNKKLLDVLACPACKSPLEYRAAEAIFVCRAERLAFPITDGTPVLLESQARPMSSEEVAAGDRRSGG